MISRNRSLQAKSGTFTLRLLFVGICGFVPNSPLFVFDKKKKRYRKGDPPPHCLSVLMPDVRVPGIGDWEKGMAINQLKEPIFYRSSHAPLMTLRPYDLKTLDNLDVAGLISDPQSGELRIVHVLDNELITFQHLDRSAWPGLTFCDKIPNHQDLQTPPLPKNDPDLYHSMWWLPRLEEISPRHGWVDSLLLTSEPPVFPGRHLACRIEVPGGNMSIVEFNDDGQQHWNFGAAKRDAHGAYQKPAAKTWTWKRAIGTVVQCDIEVAGASVELWITNSAKRMSKVTLQPRSTRRDVEVAFLNAEMESFAIRSDQPWATLPLPDPDFQALYQLSTERDKGPYPVPVDSAVGSGQKYKPCTGGMFSGARPAPKRLLRRALQPADALEIMSRTCAVFQDCNEPGREDFIAVGLSREGEASGGTVTVITKNAARTRATLSDRLPEIADRLAVIARDGSFHVPVRSRPPALNADATMATAGIDINLHRGTLGCTLVEAQSQKRYFLTAGHVVENLRPGSAVSSVMLAAQLGTLHAFSTLEKPGLDWGLVEVDPNIQSSNLLNWERPQQLLWPPWPASDIGGLNDMTIGMAGAASRWPCCGRVYLAPACVAVEEADRNGKCTRRHLVQNQILITDLADAPRPFAQSGDSGSIAHLREDMPGKTAKAAAFKAGTAIGLYWGSSTTADLYAVTPLEDVLADIYKVTHLGLRLL